jgi:hypothetical protein
MYFSQSFLLVMQTDTLFHEVLAVFIKILWKHSVLQLKSAVMVCMLNNHFTGFILQYPQGINLWKTHL